MDYKVLQKGDSLLHVYEDGRVYREGFVDRIGNNQKGKFLKFSVMFKGYLQCGFMVDGKQSKYTQHRLIAEAYLDDYSEELQVDHINGDKTDNRIDNLRMVTNQENHRSYKKVKKNATSKYRGVSWFNRDKKWRSRIMGNKLIHIGCFDNEKEAALAFDKKAIELGYEAEALNQNNFNLN